MDDDVVIVLCTLASEPSMFDDDQRGVCMKCGVAVKYRPEHAGRKYLCIACACEDEDIDEIAVTRRTVEELRALGIIKG
jgi:hypothetical protein